LSGPVFSADQAVLAAVFSDISIAELWLIAGMALVTSVVGGVSAPAP